MKRIHTRRVEGAINSRRALTAALLSVSGVLGCPALHLDGGNATGPDDGGQPSSMGDGRICQSIPAGPDGGWQFARFAKGHIVGKSATVEITMDDWTCSTAKTDWTTIDTSSPCVD